MKNPRLKTFGDPNYMRVGHFKNLMYNAIRDNIEDGQTAEDLGCLISEFKRHLESKFQPGMSWENKGRYVGQWCIFNTKFLDDFDLEDPIDRHIYFHYENFIPKWNWSGKSYK